MGKAEEECPGGHRVIDIFAIARDVVEKLSAKGTLTTPVPVAGIISIVEEMSAPTGLRKIELLCHDWKSRQFVSALFRFKDRAEIHYSAHSNLCWRRMAVCKEAIHLLMDTEQKHFTTNVPSLVEQLILGTIYSPDSLLDSEWMGEVAAIEVLLPWKLREVLKDMHKAGESDFQIAVQFRVPIKYVTAMLRGDYGKLSEKFNLGLDGKK